MPPLFLVKNTEPIIEMITKGGVIMDINMMIGFYLGIGMFIGIGIYTIIGFIMMVKKALGR